MLTPKQIVAALDKYIVGQANAKRAVAIALRNRYRRSRLSEELQDEITPKNIIMIGPTGVGKTEIARRLAKLVDTPLVKVAAAEQRLADLLVPVKAETSPVNPLQLLLGTGQVQEPQLSEEEKKTRYSKRKLVLSKLRAGTLEEELVEIEIEEKLPGSDAMLAVGIDINLNEMLGSILPGKKKKRKAPVREARRILVQEESDKLIDMDEVIREAIEKAEQGGIIFIDEIDKIAGTKSASSGPDVSREGVQRDILPIVEGSVVTTKYGPVKTDYMLFIAAGAFHTAKVSDLIPELQGRFPIRVRLDSLTQEDYKRILTQPENAITKQYQALLEADHVLLSFSDDALDAIAKYAYSANESTENIGARRLHTIMETLLEDISFNAGGDYPDVELRIDGEYVRERLSITYEDEDLHKYIL